MLHMNRLKLLIPFLILLIILLVSYVNERRIFPKEKLQSSVSEINK
jgi:hypothetical protein